MIEPDFQELSGWSAFAAVVIGGAVLLVAWCSCLRSGEAHCPTGASDGALGVWRSHRAVHDQRVDWPSVVSRSAHWKATVEFLPAERELGDDEYAAMGVVGERCRPLPTPEGTEERLTHIWRARSRDHGRN